MSELGRSKVPSILLLGGGGHCMSVLDSLLGLASYERIGIVDENWKFRSPMLGIPYVGEDQDLADLYQKGYTDAFITVGSVGNPACRMRLWELARNQGFHMPNIIDQTAAVSQNLYLGEGIYIGKRAAVNAGVRIGDGAIINTGAVVEHEAVLGAFVHVAPGACVLGGVFVEERAHIGAGAVIKQGMVVHQGAVVGMGSVVTKDVAAHMVVYGNPCCVRTKE